MKFASLFGRRSGKSPRQGVCPKGQRAPARPGFRPELELLEGRLVPTVATTTLTVTNTSGDPTVVGSLPYEVAYAQSSTSGATIVFASNLRGKTITLTSGPMDITSENVAIVGSGQTISGNGQFQIFYQDYYALSLSNLTLSNGSASSGGAIEDLYAPLSLTNVTFSNNQAASDGGAIFVDGDAGDYYTAAVTISNCKFNTNSAAIGGDEEGGAIYSEHADVIVHNSKFSTNSAYDGGAIYNYYGVLSAQKDSFTGNTAVDGGALFLDESSSNTTSGCTFSDNHAIDEGYGGAVYAQLYGTWTSTGDNFTGNTAYGGGGGAICNLDFSTILAKDTFSKNGADGGAGGAIFNEGDDSTVYALYSVSANQCTFTNNHANSGGYGGAICSAPLK